MRMKNFLKTTGIFLLLFSIVAISLTTPSLAKAEVKAFEYVALGDSLTVGYEPGMILHSVPYGFADRLYEQAMYYGRTNYTNYGIGGLKSDGLRNYLEALHFGKEITAEQVQPGLIQIDPRLEDRIAQIKKVQEKIKNANLITVTIGGNDLRDLPILYKEKSSSEFDEIVNERTKIISANVKASIEFLTKENPDALIVLADQYQPYPYIEKFTDKALYDKLNAVKDQMSAEYQRIIAGFVQEGKNIKIAQVAKEFVGNELLFTHIFKSDIHPNQNGYEKIAQVFAKTIWGTYNTPKNRNPISIVVGGVELETKNKPVMINGRTYLPIREYSEQLGAKVSWDSKTKSAVITHGDKKARFTSETVLQTADLEGSKFTGNILLYNSKVYVSLRAVAEGLQFDVVYISRSKTAYINQ